MLLRLLPKEATNRHQGFKRDKLTTFWIADDGEDCRKNNWEHEDNHMLLEDT
jgi:hypothetical protein